MARKKKKKKAPQQPAAPGAPPPPDAADDDEAADEGEDEEPDAPVDAAPAPIPPGSSPAPVASAVGSAIGTPVTSEPGPSEPGPGKGEPAASAPAASAPVASAPVASATGEPTPAPIPVLEPEARAGLSLPVIGLGGVVILILMRGVRLAAAQDTDALIPLGLVIALLMFAPFIPWLGLQRAREGLTSWVAGLRDEFSGLGATLFLLAIVGVMAYANSFFIEFLFDDAPVITRNRLLWQWDTADDLCLSLPTRALTNLTFLVTYQVFDTSPIAPHGAKWPYHVFNLLVHLGNGWLLYLLVRDLLRARPSEVPSGLAHWTALLGAIVWLVHPANTMAVSYIAQRYALMGGLAFLGTVVCYTRLRLDVDRNGGRLGGGGIGYLAGFLVSSACCAVTKENSVVVPGAVVLIEALFFGGRHLRFLCGLGLVAALTFALRLVQVGAPGGRIALVSIMAPVAVVALVAYARLRLDFRSSEGGPDTLLMGAWGAAGLALLLALVPAFPGPIRILAALYVAGLGGIEVLLLVLRWPLLVLPVAAAIVRAGYSMHQSDSTALDQFLPASTAVVTNRWDYFTTEVVVTLRYLHLFFMPHDLCVEQAFPILSGIKQLDPVSGAWKAYDATPILTMAFAGHALIATLAALLARRGHRLIPLAVAWFYLTNVIESSFIPILDPMVDHRMYLPTMLVAPALALALCRAWPWLVSRVPAARTTAPLALIWVVGALVAGTFARNQVWRSSTGIWEDNIEKRSDCARAYSSLGMEFLYLGEWTRAVGPIETALLLGPYHVEGWNNLGKAYLELKMWPQAEQALLRGIQVHEYAPSPNTPLCWNNVGLVYLNLALENEGDPAAVRKYLELASNHIAKAVELDSDYEVAWINLANSEYRRMSLSARGTPERRASANLCARAGEEASRVAARRGGDLSPQTWRILLLAMSESGRALEAFSLQTRLIAAGIAEGVNGAEDAARFALAAVLEARAANAAPSGPVAVGPRPGPAPEAPLPQAVVQALQQAASLLDQLLAAMPTRGEAAGLRGQLALQLGDIPSAVRFLRNALALLPPGSPESQQIGDLLRAVAPAPGG